MRNIIIVIFIVLAIGGITYVRMSTQDREPASNVQDQETPDDPTTPEEQPTEPEPEP